MGGHGHGPSMPPVPSPDIYKVEDVPQLKQLQEKLAEQGLKDPWLRNEVWKFQLHKGLWKRNLKMFGRGFGIGFSAFLVTIAIEKYLGGDEGHGGHGGHDKDGHH